MKTLLDCRLYAFVDSAYLHGRSPGQIAESLCRGGADLIQLRCKNWTPDQIRPIARELKSITDRSGVHLVINDFPGVARDVGASFCHLGQEDFLSSQHPHLADLGLSGPPMPSAGLSSHGPDDARRAMKVGAAYVAVGPVFPTPTKPGRPGVTLDYVRWAAAHLALPWFAIGGINLENLDSVLAAGATRVCVVSAILNHADPAAACREFRLRLG